jgi:mannosyltransferase OCH1-like enzyme
LNSDWNIVFHEDSDVDKYLRDNLSSSDYELVNDCHIVEKLDIWRLLKLYYEGGMYIDLDRLYNIPMKDIVKDNIAWVLPTNNDYDFSHDIMITAPNNPAFELILSLYFSRRQNGCNNVYFLGPQTYMHGITKYLTGDIINTNPGHDIFSFLRKTIEKTGFISTHIERSVYDTLVFQPTNDFEWFDHEKEKRKLYAEFDMKHWTGEW